MSTRYEWIDTATSIECVAPSTDLDGCTTDDCAVVIGDPYATALVVQGPLDELRDFVQRVIAAIEAGPSPRSTCAVCNDEINAEDYYDRHNIGPDDFYADCCSACNAKSAP
jgi:hypothetical protein